MSFEDRSILLIAALGITAAGFLLYFVDVRDKPRQVLIAAVVPGATAFVMSWSIGFALAHGLANAVAAAIITAGVVHHYLYIYCKV